MGYHRAGFEVVGVDKNPQPNYPFKFIQGDVFETFDLLKGEFSVFHASPPCQKYSSSTAKHRHKDYPDLVKETRSILQSTGEPYVIENVPGAPIRPDLKLSGLHFGLRVFRERWFEVSPMLILNPSSEKTHKGNTLNGSYISVTGNGGQNSNQARLKDIFLSTNWKDAAAEAMQIDWMTWKEMAQAIPPAYTEYIGKEIMKWINLNTK